MNSIPSSVIDFLSDLSENNDREWFQENKKRFQDSQQAVIDFLRDFYLLLGQEEPSYLEADPKKAIFRIYRDVRFSKNKLPYKEHLGMVISDEGRKSEKPAVYLQISPTDTFLAAGRWRPEKEELANIRQEIDYNGAEFRNLLDKLPRGFKLDYTDSLSRPPKGYDKDNENINYIKLKSFVVSQKFPADFVTKKGFQKNLLNYFQELNPFNRFLEIANK